MQVHVLAGCVAAFLVFAGAAAEEEARTAGVVMLGQLPPDNFYQTRTIQISAQDGMIVTENAVMVSRDGGLTWNISAKPSGGHTPKSFNAAWARRPDDLYVLSYVDALYKTSDLGASWTRLSTWRRGIDFLAISGNQDGQWIVTAGSKRVHVSKREFDNLPHYAEEQRDKLIPAVSISTDGGKTWHFRVFRKGLGFLDGVRMSSRYGVVWGPYEVYASMNRGKSWKELTWDGPDEDEDAYPVSAAIIDDQVLISLKNGRMVRGPISGRRLTTVAVRPDFVSDLVFFSQCTGFGITPVGTAQAGTERDILLKTEDGGATWTPLMPSKRISALTSTGSSLYGVTRDQLFRLDVEEKTGPAPRCRFEHQ